MSESTNRFLKLLGQPKRPGFVALESLNSENPEPSQNEIGYQKRAIIHPGSLEVTRDLAKELTGRTEMSLRQEFENAENPDADHEALLEKTLLEVRDALSLIHISEPTRPY